MVKCLGPDIGCQRTSSYLISYVETNDTRSETGYIQSRYLNSGLRNKNKIKIIETTNHSYSRVPKTLVSVRERVGYVKTQLSCTLFIMLMTTCFDHCGPSSGHKNVFRGKLYRV